MRSSAVWGCKENFELGTSYKLAPAGEPFSATYINFQELEKGIILIYNKDVRKGRGILLHAGFYGIWTEGCINPFRTLSEKIRDLNIELKESVELLFEIYDKIDKIGIEKVKT